MLRVDIYTISEFDQQFPDVFLWFTYKKGDDAVEVHTDYPGEEPASVEIIKKHGIVGRKGKEFKLEDKEKFLEELRFEFTGSRIRASEPYEVE